MRVDILDNDVFSALLPTEVERYLAANHWRQIRRDGHTVAVWERDGTASDKLRVWVPLDVGLADYAVAMGRLVKAVALAVNRSQLQIVEDLETIASGDVIRAGTWDLLNRAASTIPITDGRHLLRHVYLPSATAWVFSSLHASVGMAFVGAVVGEYLGSARGVGYLILQAEGVFDINTVFAGVLVLTACALVLDYAVTLAERRLLRWRPGTVSSVS